MSQKLQQNKLKKNWELQTVYKLMDEQMNGWTHYLPGMLQIFAKFVIFCIFSTTTFSCLIARYYHQPFHDIVFWWKIIVHIFCNHWMEANNSANKLTFFNVWILLFTFMTLVKLFYSTLEKLSLSYFV